MQEPGNVEKSGEGNAASRAAPNDSVNSGNPLEPSHEASASRWSQFRSHPKFWFGVVAAGVTVLLIAGGVTWAAFDAQRVEVPELVGLTTSDGLTTATDVDLLTEPSRPLPSSKLEKFTTIVSQEPDAGVRVFPGTVITFEYQMIEAEVPSVVGLSLNKAIMVLATDGFFQPRTLAQVLPLEPGDTTSAGVPADTTPEALESIAVKLGLDGDVNLTDEPFELPERKDHGDWTVTAVHPAEGEPLVAGSTVELTLALPITHVPDVVGMPAADASQLMNRMKLEATRNSEPNYPGLLPEDFELDVDYLAYRYWSDPEGETLTNRLGAPDSWLVSSQSVAPGALALFGTKVDMQVDWPTVKMPDLSGLAGDDVHKALNAAGLSGYDVTGPDAGMVRSQAQPAGTVLPAGSRVGVELAHELTFRVTSSASTGLVTWVSPNSFSIQQDNGTSLPWSKTFPRNTKPGVYERGNFSAQMDSWDGWIACEILFDGKVLEKRESTGAFAVVSCG